MASPPRKFLVLSLSLPFLLLILFLVFHTTFIVLPRSPWRWENSTVAPFHISLPPVKTCLNMTLVELLLTKTPRTQQFAERAANLFAPQRPCTHRFFMMWLSPVEQLGHRESLVIETLFRWHPDACLLIASHTMDSAGGSDRLRPFLDRGFRVAATSPDMAYLLDGTPAEGWLDKLCRGEVSPGTVAIGQNLANLLRLALLYKYGGIYMDADVVVLWPLTGLRNAIGAQEVDAVTGEWTVLNNAVLVFDRGHPVMRDFIAEFAATFDGSKWGHNGLHMVSRVAERVRHRMLELGVTVLPPQAFYTVDWNNISGLFVAPKDANGERCVKSEMDGMKGNKTFGIHLWNKVSKSLKMEDGSVIASLISQGCLFCNSSVKQRV
ncbi:unnamed protein product [Alopecurus aequalis]